VQLVGYEYLTVKRKFRDDSDCVSVGDKFYDRDAARIRIQNLNIDEISHSARVNRHPIGSTK